jgi:hypothetical protein
MNIENNVTFDHCPLCGDKKIDEVGNIPFPEQPQFGTITITLTEQPVLWQCTNCNSWFTQNIMSEMDSIRLYSMNPAIVRSSNNDFETYRSRVIIQHIDKYLAKNKQVLDIGCGMGELINYAKNRGCYTLCVEYSENTREMLHKYGHNVYKSIDDITLQGGGGSM